MRSSRCSCSKPPSLAWTRRLPITHFVSTAGKAFLCVPLSQDEVLKLLGGTVSALKVDIDIESFLAALTMEELQQVLQPRAAIQSIAKNNAELALAMALSSKDLAEVLPGITLSSKQVISLLKVLRAHDQLSCWSSPEAALGELRELLADPYRLLLSLAGHVSAQQVALQTGPERGKLRETEREACDGNISGAKSS